MKKIYKLAANFSHILRLCTIGALAILGILLTIILMNNAAININKEYCTSLDTNLLVSLIK